MGMTKMLLERFQSQVPRNMQDLLTLPGVGEKTAGVVLNQAFGMPAFPVDTHVFRVARRLGLSKEKTPNKVSRDLQRIFQKHRWKDLTMQMILHGRTLCTARKPKCGKCPLLGVCFFGQNILLNGSSLCQNAYN
jgi:endonuclease-3